MQKRKKKNKQKIFIQFNRHSNTEKIDSFNKCVHIIDEINEQNINSSLLYTTSESCYFIAFIPHTRNLEN